MGNHTLARIILLGFMKTILVSGVAGFIGSHVAEALLHKDYCVIGIDNFDPFYDIEIKKRNLYSITPENFSFFNIDIKDKDQLKNLPAGIDAVIHLAAKAGVIPSLENPGSYIETNINGTMNLLNFMKEFQINKILNASSSSVYGNHPIIPFNENAILDHPISPYAFSKRSTEILNYTYHHLYNLDIINLRLFTVYGPRQRPDLAIHKFFNLIKEGKEITVYGNGNTARDYTYIDDTVNGILSALEYIFAYEKIFETVNLGNETPVKLIDLIDTISSELNVKPIIKYMDNQAGDVEITFADISKARLLFNYNPETKLEDGIRKFNEWFNKIHASKKTITNLLVSTH